MKSRFISPLLSALLVVSLLAPSLFFVAPQEVHAQSIGVPTDDWVVRIKETLNLVSTYTNTAANVAMQINAYVLQPLAFALSGDLLKMITAGVISFVIGKANGTGIPQFVVDVQKSLQTVGDARALTFLDQFGRNSNSPFASSIASSLRNDYLSKTSLAGFWAANMNTLARSTPSYRPGYLAGNWSQGGVRAWFALTTQVQNNPYTFYQNSQERLGTMIGPGIGGATGARVAELNWGQGFTSWCGATDTGGSDGTEMESEAGVNPGDPCTDKDGNPGSIKTPGSVIVASLNKALGSQTDSILRMGNVGPEINNILRNIGTVMQTVNFATQILGGSGSGGLFGVNATSGTNPTSRLMQYQNTPGYLGVTQSSVLQNAATLPVVSSDMSGRLTQYESSWSTISSAANAASTTVASLANFCIAEQKVAPSVFNNDEAGLAAFLSASTAQANTARSVLTTTIAPVLAQASAAATTIATARAMVQRVQSGQNSTSGTASAAYLADLQTLQTMPPSDADISNALQDAQIAGVATAIPAGSLTVSGGTIVGRMSLLSTNAEALKASVCTPVASVRGNNNSDNGD
ncbi:MAG: hypothetical protein WC814_00315 [Candidatus Paceibacterota bacterium]|jgi:hypothetical protein